MAKRETAVATVEPAQTALATVPQDMLDAQGAGTEHVNPDNIRPPRLNICQTGSAQFKKTNPKYIQGIQEGDLFNNQTGEKYEAPLTFVIIQRLPTNYMQFDKGEVGKVIDYDIPAGDPRTKPTFDKDGNWVKPIATQFDNYLVLLPDTLEILSLSFKSTGLQASKFLDNMLKTPLKIAGTLISRPAAWFRQFTLSTVNKDGKGNSWATPKVEPAGIPDEGLRLAAATLYEQYKRVQVVVDHDDTDATSEAPDSDHIPF